MPRTHGDGLFNFKDFKLYGNNVIIEPTVLIFHPENISVGNDVYVGHQTILKGYYRGSFIIGDGTWIGQQCFIHSAGSVEIGRNVGIGPAVKIITSSHLDGDSDKPFIANELEFKKVIIGDNSDIGTGSVILPGVNIGIGAIVGAGSVVTKDVPEFAVVAGSPAKILRFRDRK